MFCPGSIEEVSEELQGLALLDSRGIDHRPLPFQLFIHFSSN